MKWKMSTTRDKKPNVVTQPIKGTCLYYGYPSSFSGTWNNDDCAELFSQYDLVVWGDFYQHPHHEDYANAKEISRKMLQKNKKLEFFGYVPIGLDSSVADSNLSLTEIKKRIDEWEELGVTGIFLDEFGFDYFVTRERQNEIVKYCHQKGLTIIANSWRIDYVFSKSNIYLDWIDFNGNQNNLEPLLNSNDYILFENAWYYIHEDGTQAVSHKDPWSDQTRMWEAYRYYHEQHSDYNGRTYYEQFQTKTFALDALKSTEKKEIRNKCYKQGLLASIMFNMDAYCASTENWAANGKYIRYESRIFSQLAIGEKHVVKPQKLNGATFFNKFTAKIGSDTLELIWDQDHDVPHNPEQGMHQIRWNKTIF